VKHNLHRSTAAVQLVLLRTAYGARPSSPDAPATVSVLQSAGIGPHDNIVRSRAKCADSFMKFAAGNFCILAAGLLAVS
jgi:hypothetical protein